MLSQLLDGLVTILGPIATIGKDRRELKDQALRSISMALTETSLYYRSLNRGLPENDDTEAMLAKYWSAAAIPMRHFDQGLAEACQHKSEYWVNPRQYTNKQIKDFGIRLEDVHEAYRAILRPSLLGRNNTMAKTTSKTKMATTKGKRNNL